MPDREQLLGTMSERSDRWQTRALAAEAEVERLRGEVDAARRDALTKFHAEVRQLAENLATESNWGGLSQTDYDEFLAAIDFAYLAARGETRQP